MSLKKKLLAVTLLVAVSSAALVFEATLFVTRHTFVWQAPFQLQAPLRLGLKQPVTRTVDLTVITKTPLTTDQQYLCDVFSKTSQEACVIALAIQHGENGSGQCDRYGINQNGTLDWGFMQINTLHLKRPDVKLKDLLDCHANINFAYQLFLEHGGAKSISAGFSPWVVYTTGKYKAYVVNPNFR